MTETTITNLDINLIEADPGQPRTTKTGEDFDEYIASLGESIAAEGLNNPIHVRIHPGDPGRYMIVNGECRWRAHLVNPDLRKAGVIPAIIKEFASDGEVYVNQIVDNESRRDLGPMEKIRSYGTALDRGATIEDIAAKLGKDVGAIKKDVSLLTLPEKIQNAIEDGKCSKKVAHYILQVFPCDEDSAPDKQAKAWEKARTAKNAKQAMANIDVYRADVNEQDLPGMEVTEEDKAVAGDWKKALKEFDKLSRCMEGFQKSPYSNGAGIAMVRSVAKNKKQVGGLTFFEAQAKALIKAGEKMLEDSRLYRAQSGLTGTNG